MAPIFITDKWNEINSAGGVSISIAYENLSVMPIKYATFTITPYNIVGDKITSEIGYKSTTSVRDTGPVNQNGRSTPLWKNVWYANDFSCFEIEKIEITYMNGSPGYINKKAINDTYIQAYGDSSGNTCTL